MPNANFMSKTSTNDLLNDQKSNILKHKKKKKLQTVINVIKKKSFNAIKNMYVNPRREGSLQYALSP